MNRHINFMRHAVAAAFLLCLGAPAGASDITLSNAWMRPARAGAAATGVYFDVRTDVPLKLVGARSAFAKSSAIVLVKQNLDGSSTETQVKEFDLPGGEQTRFALNGNHVELREIQEDLPPGITVPVMIEFVETKGNIRRALEIGVLVRGVILPPPPEPEAKKN